MLQDLRRAIFVGDKEWAWRRRIAVSSAATMLACIIKAAFFPDDLAHATMVMSNAMTGLGMVMTIYVAGAVVDDKFKRSDKGSSGAP